MDRSSFNEGGLNWVETFRTTPTFHWMLADGFNGDEFTLLNLTRQHHACIFWQPIDQNRACAAFAGLTSVFDAIKTQAITQ